MEGRLGSPAGSHSSRAGESRRQVVADPPPADSSPQAAASGGSAEPVSARTVGAPLQAPLFFLHLSLAAGGRPRHWGGHRLLERRRVCQGAAFAPGWTRPPGECLFPWVTPKGGAHKATRTPFQVRSPLSGWHCSSMAVRSPEWLMQLPSQHKSHDRHPRRQLAVRFPEWHSCTPSQEVTYARAQTGGVARATETASSRAHVQVSNILSSTPAAGPGQGNPWLTHH